MFEEQFDQIVRQGLKAQTTAGLVENQGLLFPRPTVAAALLWRQASPLPSFSGSQPTTQVLAHLQVSLVPALQRPELVMLLHCWPLAAPAMR